VRRQPGDQVQPGRYADRLEPGHPLGRRGQECVAAPPVDRAHPPQVPVELAAGDEVGQGELLVRGRAAVGGDLGRGHRLGQVFWHHEPPQAQPGRSADAIAIFERVAADAERILGPEHPDTLAAVDALRESKPRPRRRRRAGRREQ